MAKTSVIEALSRIAHDLWCRRMEAQGWHSGRAYDPALSTHDAMVPFDRLGPSDRRATLRAVAALGLEAELAEAVEYERGPGREFTLEEMRPGVRVAWAEGTVFESPQEAKAYQQGTIESWASHGEELTLLRVRWPDGTLSEHYPSEREFRRLE